VVTSDELSVMSSEQKLRYKIDKHTTNGVLNLQSTKFFPGQRITRVNDAQLPILHHL